MKRFWFGVCLLLMFFLASFSLSFWMTRTHTHISNHLSQACDLSQAGDLATAGEKAREASFLWQQYRGRIATMTDHTPMEEIDSLFQELEVYLRMDEPVHFASTCARLVLLVQAVGDAHGINWQTVL